MKKNKRLSNKQRVELAIIYITMTSVCFNNLLVGVAGGLFCFIFNLALFDDQEDNNDDLRGASDRFQAHCVRFANKGDMVYVGGRTFKADGLEMQNGEVIGSALITYESTKTVVVNLETNEVREILL